MGLPAHTTAATGIDAMVHAIEGYASANKNNNPISKMLAIEALKLLGGSIEKAVFEGSNIEARGNMFPLASIFDPSKTAFSIDPPKSLSASIASILEIGLLFLFAEAYPSIA